MKPAAPSIEIQTDAEPPAKGLAPTKTRSALDAFGYASLTVSELNGRCTWHSALARSLMAAYFSGGHFERGWLPPELLLWLHREALRRRAGAPPRDLSVVAQSGGVHRPSPATRPEAGAGAVEAPASAVPRRLCFTLHQVDAEMLGEGQWLIVLREADDAALMDALMRSFDLSLSEAEFLFGLLKGEPGTELVSLMASSPDLVHGGLAQLWLKLGVADADQACALVRRKLADPLEPPQCS
ncbi:hypothetical protein [Paucibacter sp. Y2R2-4]|uniref:hypothetical protein n=1 Tax=Paucibacter sp. Y2R2-4 TaxID=2893553 RepID=UPI0021E485BB|nr:hypothetical protein [Paucibacter sp. Y2R2-4]MCV2349692.1 hypothetical protein [Paucibacter sp. Y2R2-4]